MFGVGGVLEGMTAGKGYIDMSTVDVETSQRISKVGMVLREGSAVCWLLCTIVSNYSRTEEKNLVESETEFFRSYQ